MRSPSKRPRAARLFLALLATLAGLAGTVAAECHEVQCLLHVSGALRRGQRGLCALFSARIFVRVPEWFAPFDIEIDCVAVI